MGTEIEVKILDIDVAETIKKIESMGAQLEGDWLMETRIYDFPDRRMLNNKSYLRLRSEGDKICCTHKSPQKNQDYKVMEEKEILVSDFDAAASIFEALGLEEVMRFEKKRLHYRLRSDLNNDSDNGLDNQEEDIFFDLDTLPLVPSFLEIETFSLEKMEEILKLMDISPEKALPIGPRELLAHYGYDIDQIKTMTFSEENS